MKISFDVILIIQTGFLRNFHKTHRCSLKSNFNVFIEKLTTIEETDYPPNNQDTNITEQKKTWNFKSYVWVTIRFLVKSTLKNNDREFVKNEKKEYGDWWDLKLLSKVSQF